MAINIEDNEIIDCGIGVQVSGTVSDVNIRKNRIQSTGIAILESGKAPLEILKEFKADTPVSQIDEMCKIYIKEKPEIQDEKSAESFLSRFDLVKWVSFTSSSLNILDKISHMIS